MTSRQHGGRCSRADSQKQLTLLIPPSAVEDLLVIRLDDMIIYSLSIAHFSGTCPSTAGKGLLKLERLVTVFFSDLSGFLL